MFTPGTLKKSVALIVLFVFLCNTLSLPFLEANLWEERNTFLKNKKKEESPVLLAQLAQTPVSPDFNRILPMPGLTARSAFIHQKMNLPGFMNELSAYATVEKLHLAPSLKEVPEQLDQVQQPFVILIQDAHLVPEVQNNIAGLLQGLMAAKASWVGVEGAKGSLNSGFEQWRSLPDQKSLRTIIKSYVDKGILSGLELAAIARKEKGVAFNGVEDEAQYMDQVRSFQSTLASEPLTQAWRSKVGLALESAKAKNYSEPLRILDLYETEYLSGRKSLVEWLLYIDGCLKPSERASMGKNAALFIKAAQMEKDLDIKVLGNEQKNLIQELSKKANNKEIAALMEDSLALRMDRIKPSEFYVRFLHRLGSAGIYVSPAMKSYLNYSLTAEQINKDQFLDEINALTDQVWSVSLSNSKSKDAAQTRALDEQFALAQKALDFKLTQAESEKFKSQEILMGRLAENLNAMGFKVEVKAQEVGALKASLQSSSRFCALSRERSNNFLKVIRQRLQSEGSKALVLIAGGFHSQDLEKSWQKEGISYVTLRPRMQKISRQDPLNFFRSHSASLNQSFLPEKLSLATPLASLTVPAVQKHIIAELKATSPKDDRKVDETAHTATIKWLSKIINYNVKSAWRVEEGLWLMFVPLYFIPGISWWALAIAAGSRALFMAAHLPNKRAELLNNGKSWKQVLAAPGFVSLVYVLVFAAFFIPAELLHNSDLSYIAIISAALSGFIAHRWINNAISQNRFQRQGFMPAMFSTNSAYYRAWRELTHMHPTKNQEKFLSNIIFDIEKLETQSMDSEKAYFKGLRKMPFYKLIREADSLGILYMVYMSNEIFTQLNGLLFTEEEEEEDVEKNLAFRTSRAAYYTRIEQAKKAATPSTSATSERATNPAEIAPKEGEILFSETTKKFISLKLELYQLLDKKRLCLLRTDTIIQELRELGRSEEISTKKNNAMHQLRSKLSEQEKTLRDIDCNIAGINNAITLLSATIKWLSKIINYDVKSAWRVEEGLWLMFLPLYFVPGLNWFALVVAGGARLLFLAAHAPNRYEQSGKSWRNVMAAPGLVSAVYVAVFAALFIPAQFLDSSWLGVFAIIASTLSVFVAHNIVNRSIDDTRFSPAMFNARTTQSAVEAELTLPMEIHNLKERLKNEEDEKIRQLLIYRIYMAEQKQERIKNGARQTPSGISAQEQSAGAASQRDNEDRYDPVQELFLKSRIDQLNIELAHEMSAVTRKTKGKERDALSEELRGLNLGMSNSEEGESAPQSAQPQKPMDPTDMKKHLLQKIKLRLQIVEVRLRLLQATKMEVRQTDMSLLEQLQNSLNELDQIATTPEDIALAEFDANYTPATNSRTKRNPAPVPEHLDALPGQNPTQVIRANKYAAWDDIWNQVGVVENDIKNYSYSDFGKLWASTRRFCRFSEEIEIDVFNHTELMKRNAKLKIKTPPLQKNITTERSKHLSELNLIAAFFVNVLDHPGGPSGGVAAVWETAVITLFVFALPLGLILGNVIPMNWIVMGFNGTHLSYYALFFMSSITFGYYGFYKLHGLLGVPEDNIKKHLQAMNIKVVALTSFAFILTLLPTGLFAGAPVWFMFIVPAIMYLLSYTYLHYQHNKRYPNNQLNLAGSRAAAYDATTSFAERIKIAEEALENAKRSALEKRTVTAETAETAIEEETMMQYGRLYALLTLNKDDFQTLAPDMQKFLRDLLKNPELGVTIIPMPERFLNEEFSDPLLPQVSQGNVQGKNLALWVAAFAKGAAEILSSHQKNLNSPELQFNSTLFSEETFNFFDARFLTDPDVTEDKKEIIVTWLKRTLESQKPEKVAIGSRNAEDHAAIINYLKSNFSSDPTLLQKLKHVNSYYPKNNLMEADAIYERFNSAGKLIIYRINDRGWSQNIKNYESVTILDLLTATNAKVFRGLEEIQDKVIAAGILSIQA